MASIPVTPLTEQQYLELERRSQTKHEFHAGQMFAMAGGSLNHSLLGGSICSLLRQKVSPGCRAFNSDLRINVPAHGLYTYADASVICGAPRFGGDPEGVVNPALIVEVLSPSSEGYDRGKKFEMYRSLESFREYLIIHQDRWHVEHYSKQPDGSWLLRDHVGPGALIAIPWMSATFTLDELYAGALPPLDL